MSRVTLNGHLNFMELRGSESSEEESEVVIVDKRKVDDIGIFDLWIVFGVTAVAVVSRIWRIREPRVTMVQEQYFGVLLNRLMKGELFLGNDPPMGVLVLGLFARMCGYKGDVEFEKFDLDVYENLRFIGACLSGFIPVLAYLLLRWIRIGRNIALTTSAMIICETSFISEARLINVECVYQFFLTASIVVFMLSCKFDYRSRTWWVVIGLSGIAFGCLFATRLSAVYVIPFVMSYEFYVLRKQFCKDQLPGRESVPIRQILYGTVFATFVVLIFSLVIFLFIIVVFVSLVALDPMKAKQSSSLGALIDVGAIFHAIRRAQNQDGLNKDVRFAASVFMLPLGAAKMYVMWRDGSAIFATHIHYLNCILGSSAVVVCLVLWLMSGRFSTRTKSHISRIVPFAIGYVSFYLSLIISRKHVYASDYSTNLLFGILCFGSSIHFLLKDIPFIQGFCATVAQFVTVFGFVMWFPLAYGLPGGQTPSRQWLHSWLD